MVGSEVGSFDAVRWEVVDVNRRKKVELWSNFAMVSFRLVKCTECYCVSILLMVCMQILYVLTRKHSRILIGFRRVFVMESAYSTENPT